MVKHPAQVPIRSPPGNDHVQKVTGGKQEQDTNGEATEKLNIALQKEHGQNVDRQDGEIEEVEESEPLRGRGGDEAVQPYAGFHAENSKIECVNSSIVSRRADRWQDLPKLEERSEQCPHDRNAVEDWARRCIPFQYLRSDEREHGAVNA